MGTAEKINAAFSDVLPNGLVAKAAEDVSEGGPACGQAA